MDNPGCSCSFCQPKIEAGILAKSNLAFVFDNWPFHRRSVLNPSRPSSLSQIARHLQTRFPHASFIPLFKLPVFRYFIFSDCEWPLCWSVKTKRPAEIQNRLKRRETTQKETGRTSVNFKRNSVQHVWCLHGVNLCERFALCTYRILVITGVHARSLCRCQGLKVCLSVCADLANQVTQRGSCGWFTFGSVGSSKCLKRHVIKRVRLQWPHYTTGGDGWREWLTPN